MEAPVFAGLLHEMDGDNKLHLTLNPSLSYCQMSDDTDTALGDDLSEVTDDTEQATASPTSFSDGDLIEGDHTLSDITMDGTVDTKTGSPVQRRENEFELYLQSVSVSAADREKKLDLLVKGDKTANLSSPSVAEVESEFEVLTVRRSTSLKTYKTPPGSPHRKKEVRFADALGLDLESVRHIMNTSEPPIVPASATRHLNVDSGTLSGSPLVRKRLMHPCFPQPGLSPNFAARVAERKVALHSFRADYDVISGTICVANIAYEKRVLVRYTFDAWVTYNDMYATYVEGSNTGSTDLFRFSIQLTDTCCNQCSFVEFSIMFSTGSGDEVYWDSNFGSNYRVDCYFI